MKTNRSSKRIFTFLLALSLALTTVPAPIWAEEPAQSLCPCCEAVPEWVEVNSQTENPFSAPGHYRLTENVTLQYVSTESRVKALETEQTRLLELLENAETMEDLLTIEARLTDVRWELENYASQLRVLDNQVN